MRIVFIKNKTIVSSKNENIILKKCVRFFIVYQFPGNITNNYYNNYRMEIIIFRKILDII